MLLVPTHVAKRTFTDRGQGEPDTVRAHLNGAQIDVRPIPVARARALIAEPAAFIAALEGARIEAIVCRSDLDALFCAMVPHARWSDIPRAEQGNAAAALLDALADASEAAAPARWRVDRIQAAEADGENATIAVMASIGGRACPALLRPQDEALAARLAFAFGNWPARGAQFPGAVLLRLCAGVTLVSLRDLRSLEPGDVLRILDPQPGARVAVLGEARAGLWGPGERAPAFRDMKPARDSRLRRFLMSADMTDDLHAPADVESFDDLHVSLVFELGRVSVPLSELRDAGPDDVFDLAGKSGHVDILHQGARVGVGEMVRTGDVYGVRVIRMFNA